MSALRVLPLLACLSACQIAVPVTPLRGPAPAAVMVLRPRNLTNIPNRRLLDVVGGVDVALRERDYRVLTLPVGFDLADQQGIDPAAEPTSAQLARLKLTADVDAVLLVEVRAWNPVGRPLERAEWDIDWRLVSTLDGSEQWSHHEAGFWRPTPGRAIDPTRAPDAEPTDVKTFGLGPDVSFRSADELVLALHRTAFARLPARTP